MNNVTILKILNDLQKDKAFNTLSAEIRDNVVALRKAFATDPSRNSKPAVVLAEAVNSIPTEITAEVSINKPKGSTVDAKSSPPAVEDIDYLNEKTNK